MSTIKNFEDLECWKEARVLVKIRAPNEAIQTINQRKFFVDNCAAYRVRI